MSPLISFTTITRARGPSAGANGRAMAGATNAADEAAAPSANNLRLMVKDHSRYLCRCAMAIVCSDLVRRLKDCVHGVVAEAEMVADLVHEHM